MDEEFLVDGITHGFKISDVNDAKVQSVNCKNHPSAIKNSVLVEKELSEQLQQGCYVKCNVKPQIVSALGAIPKNEGSEIRLIHDCSRPVGAALNDYSTLHSVQYQTLDNACELAKPNYFMAKIDLKAAYRSVRIHPDDYHLTGIGWQFQGDKDITYLYDTRLPFGAAMAPSIFHRVTQSVRRMMASLGFSNLVVYLDDFLCVEETYERCLAAQNTLISLLVSLGFQISWRKVMGPSQVITFLGIVIDTRDCTLSLSGDKVKKLKDKLSWFQSKKRASKRQLQSLAGSLNWACQAVRGGRYFLRRVIDSVNRLKRQTHKCKLSKAFKLDVKWWLCFLDTFNGSVYFRNCETAVLMTDACMEGAGVFTGGDWFYTNWLADAPHLAHLHINYKEVMAALLAFERWAPLWQNKSITVLTDSVVAKAVLNRGSCRNELVMSKLRDVFWLSVAYNFKFKAAHIPGKLNCLPDAISRLHEPGQIPHVVSLLRYWHHSAQTSPVWLSHMSPSALRTISHHLERWGFG